MKTVTITIPTFPNPVSKVANIFRNTVQPKISSLISSVSSFSDFAQQSPSQPFVSERSSRLNGLKRSFNFQKNKKFFIIGPLVLGGIVLAILVGSFVRNSNSGVMGASSETVKLSKPLAEKDITKTFSFPVLDDTEKEVGKIQYIVEKASIRDEFVINGQKATALDGRAFLILSLKMKNDTESTVSINTRDFVRMKPKGSDELFAPTIHNDPVDVQAISTLPTQLGFPITDDVKEFSLQVGEISGKKETIEVKF